MLLVALSALAKDDFLYAPAPPADAAFVRVVHAAPGGGPVSGKVGATTFPEVGYAAATPYLVVTGGPREVAVGGKPRTETFTAGGFYTIAVTGGGALVLVDEANPNLAKSLVCLYNLSDRPALDLKTADGALTLVTAVKPGKSACRAVNPVKADFAATGAAAPIALPAGQLEAGAVYAALVVGTGDKLTGTWVRASTRN